MKLAKNYKMNPSDKLQTEEIAYCIGVFQTDGYFKKQYVKSQQITKYYISLSVCDKSLPMLEKFQKISQKYFKIKGTRYITNYENKLNYFKFGCKQFL
ncbi:hypothetical protein ACFLTH_13570, partial [Bacteroidota bacterium]